MHYCVIENVSSYAGDADLGLILAIIVFDNRRCPFELTEMQCCFSSVRPSCDMRVHMRVSLCSITSVFHHVSQM